MVALDDDEHVEIQRERYRLRLELMADALSRWSGSDVPLPAGGFYLWFEVDDGWAFAERLARGRCTGQARSSTEHGVPTTCVSPWYNLPTVSTSSSSA